MQGKMKDIVQSPLLFHFQEFFFDCAIAKYIKAYVGMSEELAGCSKEEREILFLSHIARVGYRKRSLRDESVAKRSSWFWT